MAVQLVLLLCYAITVAANPLAFPIEAKQASRNSPALAKRGLYAEHIDAYHTDFQINVTVGTPPQQMRLLVDTAGSDIYLTDYYYYPNDSSTYIYLNNYLDVYTGTHRNATQGAYFKDRITFADGLSLDNVTMAYLPDTGVGGFFNESFQGVLGLTYNYTEAGGHTDPNGTYIPFTYPNILEQLVNEKKIDTEAYGLWLGGKTQQNSPDGTLITPNNDGQLVLGGIDTAQFHGTLKATPHTQPFDDWAYFWVNISGLSLVDGNNRLLFRSSDEYYPAPALVDTGTSDTGLAPDLFDFFYQYYAMDTAYYNLTGDEPPGYRFPGYTVPCSWWEAANAGSLIYEFIDIDGLPFEIVVPVKDMFNIGGYYGETLPTDAQPQRYANGSLVCNVSTYRSYRSDKPTYMGLAFQRAAYVVYDLKAYTVGFAPAVRGPLRSSNLVPITKPNSWVGTVSAA